MKLPAGLARLARPTPGTATSLPQLLTLVAAAGVAGQLALLAWKFVPGSRRPPPPPPPQASRPVADIGDVLRARLFGTAAVSAADGSSAPRTRVALVLAGTLAVRDPTAGLAIIGESAQTARVYAVGAALPGGVRLHEVYTDRVVLERDGTLETLPLPRQLAGGTAISGAPGLSPPGNGTEPPLADSVQRLIAQGPEVIGEVLRPMPTYAGGQLKGFKVYAGRDRRKFAKLGLQPGDLVTSINGVPLGDAQRGMEILRTLGGAGTATVTVERNGAVQQLNVDASQVAGLAPNPADAAAVPPVAPPGPDAPPNSD